jgi:hypothetical protein
MAGRSSQRALLMAAAALGVSSTVFLGYLSHLTSPNHLLVYHYPGDPAALYVPVIANVLLLAAACFAAFFFPREGTILHRLIWSLVLCIYPWFFIKNVCNFMRLSPPHAFSLVIFGLCFSGFLLLTLVRSDVMNHAFAWLRSFGVTIFVASGLVGAFALLEATWFGVEGRHLNEQPVLGAVARPLSANPHGPVLWIVLDELGYRQLYENRLPGLQLPAFDQLRGESTVFSNVQPAGFDTEIVLPALMSGNAADHIRSSADGRLFIHDSRGWHSFDQHDTVFADADALGYRSSVVGSYNPYCRILPAVLDSCFWSNRGSTGGFIANSGIIPNLLQPIRMFASKFPRFLGLGGKSLSPEDEQEGKWHTEEFIELARASDVALANSQNTFLLLHMPIPHPEGIWDRQTNRFAINRSNYVDNLVLADEFMAHVRRLLEANGQWDSATVIVMGDHAWRTKMWTDRPSFKRDDWLASDGGKFDPRPGYLIKLPNQHTPATVENAFPAMQTRPLLDELVRGQIANPAQLQQWVARHAGNSELSQGSARP